MKITKTNVALVVLSLGVVGLSAALLTGKGPQPAPASVVPEGPQPKPACVPEAPGAVERALRLRIRRLEAELKSALEAAGNPTDASDSAEVKNGENPAENHRPGPREWMENFRKNDPKGYERMRTRFAQMRKRQSARTQSRLEYFGSIDTSGMSEAERANHERLQDLLVRRENLPEFNENMTDEEMRAAGQERRELERSIRKANEAERTALLKQTVNLLELPDDDATELTAAIQEVIRATDSDHGGPHGPPPPPGGGPR